MSETIIEDLDAPKGEGEIDEAKRTQEMAGILGNNEEVLFEVRKEMERNATFPEKCVVTSKISLVDQSIYIDQSDAFLSQMNEIAINLGTGNLEKLARFTAINLSADNHKEWEKVALRGEIISITDVIDRKCCTCFHRTVFFNILMNQLGINSMPVTGEICETKNRDLSQVSLILKHADFSTMIDAGDFTDQHCRNIIEKDSKYYLVDTAALVDDRPLIKEIELDDNESVHIFSFEIGPGLWRHYRFTKGRFTFQNIG